MTEQIHLTQKERQVYFYKLLLIYGIGLLVLFAIIFWKAPAVFTSNERGGWETAYRENQQFADRQLSAVQLIDSMAADMRLLRGEARQIFVERDVQNLSRQLRGLYNEASADLRYVSFLQAADFMSMRLEDVQTLNKKLGNINNFQQQLTSCEIGRSRR